ncbi:hypothetical protein BpHYR1_014836 [Brachionus plicatilis]|uniref:Uncharacterized protein n=1 Tax=Brachionus plicatilis TaxID=10195 RepID=A0A3M7QIJ3_BRAPC|nr:hypothetical protein BpHYR1_014836 [Brachionus plicatilis]
MPIYFQTVAEKRKKKQDIKSVLMEKSLSFEKHDKCASKRNKNSFSFIVMLINIQLNSMDLHLNNLKFQRDKKEKKPIFNFHEKPNFLGPNSGPFIKALCEKFNRIRVGTLIYE